MRLEVQNQKSLLTILLAADSHGLVIPLEDEYISIRTVMVEICCGDKRKRILAALD